VVETPSLWREFVWPLYDCREECIVMNVLKDYGNHIKRLVFPDHVSPPLLLEMLSHCKNVAVLSLPPGTRLDAEVLRLAVQHMEHLEKVKVQLSSEIIPLLEISGLKELTVHVPEEYQLMCTSWVLEWIKYHCIPCKLNLVTEVFDFEVETEFIESMLQRRFTPLNGYTSCLNLFYKFSVPLNLFPSKFLPEYQFQFGQTDILPFVKASNCGMVDLDGDILVLVKGVCNGKLQCRTDTGSPTVWNYFHDRNLKIVVNNSINSLRCVTEFNLAYGAEFLRSEHLEQLAVACPHLKCLNLQGGYGCLASLQGLRAISYQCPDLCGLNLKGVSRKNHIELWEILSNMNLTHLVVDNCVLHDPAHEEHLISLFQKCLHLQALQFCYCHCNNTKKWSLLSHFPVLRYCNVSGDQHSKVVQQVIRKCRKLTVLICYCFSRLLILSAYAANLQQFHIESIGTNIPDIFMETVSTHGGLVHVVMFVNSITIEGIATLISNSSKLLTFTVCAEVFICNRYEWRSYNHDEGLKENLQKRFSGRKLFSVGSFNMDRAGIGFYNCSPGTDLFPLWPNYYCTD